MKKLLIFLSALFFSSPTFAQKIELSAQLYTNAFRYTGASAVNESFIIQTSDDTKNYTNNPYGKKYAYGYGASMQAQFVGRCGIIFGLQSGYEQSRSEVSINQVYQYMIYFLPSANYAYFVPAAIGKSYLKNYFINVNPYLGYRFKLKQFALDVLPGLDVGLPVAQSHENGKATTTYSGQVYTTNLQRDKPPLDFRTQLALALQYKQFGLQASYARGSTNYEQNVIGDNGNYVATSELFRLGLSYRVL